MMEKRTKQHGNGTVSIFQCFCWRDSVHYNTEKSQGDVIFRPVESFVHVFDKDVCCVGDRGLACVDVRCPQLPQRWQHRPLRWEQTWPLAWRLPGKCNELWTLYKGRQLHHEGHAPQSTLNDRFHSLLSSSYIMAPHVLPYDVLE